jgi:flavin reductase (DIM6/NTAB) family NADH-FMN oxidoreductase RutF/DNA-binding IclR family transcriptional regulator
MVVGTFTSVSLDPPMVGFLADRASTTWPVVKAQGRYTASVLTAEHEPLCRAIVAKDPTRFERFNWTRSPAGLPMVPDAKVWFDCVIHSVVPAGDHYFVLGSVQDMGVGETAAPPLIFHRGGYGWPKLPGLDAEDAGLAVLIRYADIVYEEAAALAADLGLDCLISAAVDGNVTLLRAAGPSGGGRRVGTYAPLAAPIGALFVAWGSAADQHRWLQRSGELFKLVSPNSPTPPALNAQAADTMLAAVRECGYTVSTGRAMSESFDAAVNSAGPDGQRRALAAFLATLTEHADEHVHAARIESLSDVTYLHMPVFDAEGRVVLVLDLTGFPAAAPPADLSMWLEQLQATAQRCTAKIVLQRPRRGTTLVATPDDAFPTRQK